MLPYQRETRTQTGKRETVMSHCATDRYGKQMKLGLMEILLIFSRARF